MRGVGLPTTGHPMAMYFMKKLLPHPFRHTISKRILRQIQSMDCPVLDGSINFIVLLQEGIIPGMFELENLDLKKIILNQSIICCICSLVLCNELFLRDL